LQVNILPLFYKNIILLKTCIIANIYQKPAQIISMKKVFDKMSYLFLIFALTISICAFSGCGDTQTQISVDSIEISKKNIYLAEGQTAVISAQVFPFNATNQNVIWSSTNENVVMIENGFVTANKAGDAVIEVISEDGGYKGTCNVLVTTASNNLALNDYNNLNMPPRELEPIYNSQDYNSNDNKSGTSVSNTSRKTQNDEFALGKTTKSVSPVSKTKEGKTPHRIAQNLVKRASAEVQDDKTVASSVLNDFASELQNSIDDLSLESELFDTQTENSILSVFDDIHKSIIDDIKTIKQEMLNCIYDVQQKIDNDEYTVQRKDLNGVTFVVISNESNEEQFENL
jgi:hypothetical protein